MDGGRPIAYGQSVRGPAPGRDAIGMRRVILNLHGIGTPRRPLEPGEAPYWIGEPLFEAAVAAARAAAGRVRVDFTFDDGNLSDLVTGAPLLARHGIAAEFFVLAGRIGEPGSLDAAGLRELLAMGHAVGSHGWAHADWRAQDAAGLERELVAARARIAEAAGREVEAAAIPFGRYDGRVVRALARAGYARVYSSDGGPARPGAFPLPRTSLRADMTPETVRAVIEGEEPALRGLRRRIAMAVKRRV